MAGKTTASANEFLKLILLGERATGGIYEELGIAPPTNTTGNQLKLSLHTADPGVGGSMTTNACAYAGYAPVTKLRSNTSFTITGNVANPTANIDFPKCTGGSETATHLGISTETGKLIWSAALSPVINVANGVIPRIDTTSTLTET